MAAQPQRLTEQDAQAGLDLLKAQRLILRSNLTRLEDLIASLTAERAVALIDRIAAGGQA